MNAYEISVRYLKGQLELEERHAKRMQRVAAYIIDEASQRDANNAMQTALETKRRYDAALNELLIYKAQKAAYNRRSA